MSAEGKKKGGIAGVSNAKHVPYRYVGGTHEHPVLTDPNARVAVNSAAASAKITSTYYMGLMGGAIAASLGFDKGFENWRDYLPQDGERTPLPEIKTAKPRRQQSW